MITQSVNGRPAGAGLAAVLAVFCVLAAGCSGTEPPPREGPVDLRAELMARPSVEEMTARYRQMQDRIRAEVDAAIGPQRWQQFDPPTQTPCGFDFPREYDARAFNLGLTGFRAGIPDDRWPQVERIVLAIAADHGFTDPAELRIDQPGRHEVGAVDRKLGANFSFSTRMATVISIGSGCHLPAARKSAPGNRDSAGG